MIRAIVFLVLLTAVMLGVAWFAERPGSVAIVWQGWRIDTSVPILIAATAFVAAALATIIRLWGVLTSAPRAFGRWRRERRRRKGYVALTQGMVAVAAGDPDEARRQARRADVLLNEPPLTMLLSAQAAQLNGDEDAARRYFEKMLESPETEFLGLRGLLVQAIREGDNTRAIGLARRARGLRPKTPWVLSTLLDLETRVGAWGEAAETLAQVQRIRALPASAARHHEAAILIEQSRQALSEKRARDALRLAEQANRAEPGHLAAVIWLAERSLDAGKARAVERLVEQEWPRRPHPDLLTAYRRARPVAEPLQWVKQVERLARLAPLHIDSMIALGVANLEAKLWGEARRNFTAAIKASDDQPPASLCRLMARLEEEENGDQVSARRWLTRTADAPADPAWVCEACGTAHVSWQALCVQCGRFDMLGWRAPSRIQPTLIKGMDDRAELNLPAVASKDVAVEHR